MRTRAASTTSCRMRRSKASGRRATASPSWRLREDGQVLLRKRPEAGLLGGMLEVPSTDWADRLAAGRAMRSAPRPCAATGGRCPAVCHIFTHFRLELMVFRAHRAGQRRPDVLGRARALPLGAAPRSAQAALPSVMRKIIAHALKEN